MGLAAFSHNLPDDSNRVLAIREDSPLCNTAFIRADNDNATIYEVPVKADLDALVAANNEFRMCMGADGKSVGINETQIDCEKMHFSDSGKASVAHFLHTTFAYLLKADFVGALCFIQNYKPDKRERKGKFNPIYEKKRGVYKHG